jgi:hypothetical protein
MKKVKVDELVKYINENFNVDGMDVSRDDFKDGSGVYGIFVGSRGYIDEIFKVEGELVLKSKDELVNDWMGDEEETEYLRSYGEEFCDSGEIDWNDLGGLYEGLNEEESIEYYDVEV